MNAILHETMARGGLAAQETLRMSGDGDCDLFTIDSCQHML